MFNIGSVLKRAWQILWSYKLLWLFALLLALSGGASSSGGGGGSSSGYSANFENGGIIQNFTPPAWYPEVEDWIEQNIAPLFATEQKAFETMAWLIGGIILFSIVIGLLLALVRYPSETAVMRLVDEHEQTGIKYRFKEAWKLGWNRRAWRLFLIDLLIGTPAFAVVMTLVGLIVWMAFRLADSVTASLNTGLIIGMIIFVLLIIAFAIFMWFVSLLRQYVARYNTLENTGVWESFRRGWTLYKTNFKNTFLMGLVMVGVGIGVGVAMMIAVFLLIPAYLLLVVPGALVAAVPGGIAYGITSLFAPEVWPWIIGGFVALMTFFMVVFSPLSFLGGAFTVYSSNVWTLTFRRLHGVSTPPPLAQPPVMPES
ncbi:MAG: hypothetical protein KBF64_01370 [Anaerolineaceae bacterium]|jgi:hypothetical protein|nr:hypothetical protein [Anaerolineaceae bacterium]